MSGTPKSRYKTLSLKKKNPKVVNGKISEDIERSFTNLRIRVSNDIELIEPIVPLVVINDSLDENIDNYIQTNNSLILKENFFTNEILEEHNNRHLNVCEQHGNQFAGQDSKNNSICYDVRPSMTMLEKSYQYSDVSSINSSNQLFNLSARLDNEELNGKRKTSRISAISFMNSDSRSSFNDLGRSSPRKSDSSIDLSLRNGIERTVNIRRRKYFTPSDCGSFEELPSIAFTPDCQPLTNENLNNKTNNSEYSSLKTPTYATNKTNTPDDNNKIKTPTYHTKPTERKSSEKCSINKIRQTHFMILDELYGDVWKTIPKLFKTKEAGTADEIGAVAKKLDFQECTDLSQGDENGTKDIELRCDELQINNKPETSVNVPENPRKKTAKKLNNTDLRKQDNTGSNDFVCNELLTNHEQLNNVQENTSKKATTKAPKNKRLAELSEHVNEKIKDKADSYSCTKISFIGSLADNVPTYRCHPDALFYKKNYKTQKDALMKKLYIFFNDKVFKNQLKSDMSVTWDSKLRSTAGTTTNRLLKVSKRRESSIRLAEKVVDTPQRLRDTLIHEMCHSATWIIDNEIKAGHGPLWKKWATRALRSVPELGEISRCHNLEIHYKFTYKCVKCGYSINRHSKSLDTENKVCGYCYGKFELIVNKKNKDGVVVSTPAKSAEVKGFAVFVKNNYGSVKKSGSNHAQVMKALSEQYSASKSNR